MEVQKQAGVLTAGKPTAEQLEKINLQAKTPLAAMVQMKIIGGSNGKLNPTGNVTRAEVAKMLYEMKQQSDAAQP